jgi:hypothetical protein
MAKSSVSSRNFCKQTEPAAWMEAQLPYQVSGSRQRVAWAMNNLLTYVGYREASVSPERVAKNSPKTYSPPVSTSLNAWGLSG